jgi:hypothetical protein
MIERAAADASLEIKAHPHMLRRASGYASPTSDCHSTGLAAYASRSRTSVEREVAGSKRKSGFPQALESLVYDKLEEAAPLHTAEAGYFRLRR